MPPPLPPIDLPGYKLGETMRLTRVGFWVRARQVRIGRDVLIKIARPQDGRAAKVLASEVRLLRELPHPSFLTLIDYYPEVNYPGGAVPCAVYELPQGQRLDAITRPFAPDRAAALCYQLAEVMQALSERSHWFRCLPPTDVFVDSNGRARITHLENLQPEGFSPDANVDLWVVSPGVRERGAVFLLGLHFFSLLTGKVPVPGSVERSPARWIDMAARTLKGTESGPAKACLGLLRQLFSESSSHPLGKIVEKFEKIKHGGAERVKPLRGRGSSIKPALVALALFVGALLGASGWLGFVGEEAADEELGVARGPTDNEAPAVEDHSVSKEVDATLRTGASDRELRTREESRKPESRPPEAETSAGSVDGAGESPTLAEQEEGSRGHRLGGVDSREPLPSQTVPLLKPASPPSPLEQYVARITVDTRDGQPRSEEHFRALWREGIGLARRELAPRGGGAGVKAGTQSTTTSFYAVLLRLGARLEEYEVRRSLFRGTVVERRTPSEVSVRYEFSSRQELRDWIAVGEESRVTISEGRLVVLGEVHYVPGRFFATDFRVRIRVPAGGRHRERPNVNVLLGLAPGRTASALKTRPLLLGYGSFFGKGRIRASHEGSSAVDLPANVVATLDGYPEQFEPDSWRIYFVTPTVLSNVEKGGEIFTIERKAGSLRWLRGEEPLASPAALAGAGSIAEAAEPRTFGFHSFGATTIDLTEVTVEGRLDSATVAAEAEKRALVEIRRELPWLRR